MNEPIHPNDLSSSLTKQADEIHKERRFLLERTYQFINFGILTMGLGLTACFAEKAQPFRTTLALTIAALFLGATLIGVFSWKTYRQILAEERKIYHIDHYNSPSYWWVFFGGIGFGVIGVISFTYIATL